MKRYQRILTPKYYGSQAYNHFSMPVPKAFIDAPGLYYSSLQYVDPMKVEINWNHPMTEGLAVYMFPGRTTELVAGKPIENVGDGTNKYLSGYGGRPGFRLTQGTDDNRFRVILDDDPYWSSMNGPFSMVGHGIMPHNNTNQCYISIDNTTTYSDLHLVNSQINANDPVYCQWVVAGFFELQANYSSSPTRWKMGAGWDFFGIVAGGSNDLRCLINNNAWNEDLTGAVANATYNEFGPGARRFSSNFQNPMEGAVGWCALWKRKLTDYEIYSLRADPYQILKVKR